MAFKIDWDAISNKTPEQRNEERRTHYEQLAARLKLLVEGRITMIKALLANQQAVPEQHWVFLRDLEYKSTTYGLDGLLGESLANLSDRQASYLEGLYKSYGSKKQLNQTRREAV